MLTMASPSGDPTVSLFEDRLPIAPSQNGTFLPQRAGTADESALLAAGSGGSRVGVGGLPTEQAEDAAGEDFGELLAASIRSVRREIRRRGNVGYRHGNSQEA